MRRSKKVKPAILEGKKNKNMNTSVGRNLNLQSRQNVSINFEEILHHGASIPKEDREWQKTAILKKVVHQLKKM